MKPDAVPTLKCLHCPDKRKYAASTADEHSYNADLTKFFMTNTVLLQKEIERNHNLKTNVVESECHQNDHCYAKKEVLKDSTNENGNKNNSLIEVENHYCIYKANMPKFSFSEQIIFNYPR